MLLANYRTEVNAPAPLTGTTPLMFAIQEGALSPNGLPLQAKMAREAVLRGEAREEDFVGMGRTEEEEGVGCVFLSKPMCEIVELLLADRRIEVNARDVAGWTALHIAVQRGSGEGCGDAVEAWRRGFGNWRWECGGGRRWRLREGPGRWGVGSWGCWRGSGTGLHTIFTLVGEVRRSHDHY